MIENNYKGGIVRSQLSLWMFGGWVQILGLWGLIGWIKGDSLTISPDKLIIHIGKSAVEVSQLQIQSIKLYQSIGAIKIEHVNPNLPQKLFFSSAWISSIIDTLKKNGYDVIPLKSFSLNE